MIRKNVWHIEDAIFYRKLAVYDREPKKQLQFFYQICIPGHFPVKFYYKNKKKNLFFSLKKKYEEIRKRVINSFTTGCQKIEIKYSRVSTKF